MSLDNTLTKSDVGHNEVGNVKGQHHNECEQHRKQTQLPVEIARAETHTNMKVLINRHPAI